MLLFYEFKKAVFKRRTLITITIVIILYSAAFSFSAISDISRLTLKEEDKVFELYEKDPEYTIKLFSENKALNEQYQQLWKEAMRAGNIDYKSPPMPATLFELQTQSDYTLLNRLMESKLYSELHVVKIDTVLSEAKRQLKTATQGFTVQYEKNIISVYSQVKDVEIPVGVVHGFDVFFGSYLDCIIILIAITYFTPTFFANEYETEGINLIFCTPKGKKQIVLAKLLAAIVFSAVLTIFLTTIKALLIYVFYGFSDYSAPVQLMRSFELCPFKMNMLQLVTADFAIKCVTVFVFVALSAFFQVCFRSSRLAFLGCLFIVCVEYSLFAFSSSDSFSMAQRINLFSTINTESFFGKYNVVNLFGQCAEQLSTTLIAMLLIFVFCVLLCTLGYPYILKKKHKRTRIIKYKTQTLLGYEFKKTLSIKNIVVFLVFFAYCLLVSFSMAKNYKSYTDFRYLEYMQQLEGVRTEAKSAYIRSLCIESDRIISLQQSYENDYYLENISYEEYSEYRRHLTEAKASRKALELLASVDNYLKAEKDACYVYEKGYQIILKNKLTHPALLVVMILLSGIFADEYKNNYHIITNITIKGRDTLFKRKLLFSALVAAVVFFVTVILELSAVNVAEYFPSGEYPVNSLVGFNGIYISLNTYCILIYIIRFVIIELCALSTALISYFSKNALFTLCISSAMFFVPFALCSELYTIIINSIIINNLAIIVAIGLILIIPLIATIIYQRKVKKNGY